MRDEVAALRLMLREVGATNGSGIDYALRCQRERDEARDTAQREIAALRTRLAAVEAERDALRDQRDGSFEDVVSLDGCLERATARAALLERELATTQRELHRLIHGTAIEGDGACEHEIHADAARAWARLWHREARRLWREVQALSGEMATARASALREAADIARAHGGISAYYAIRQLAAEVEP